MQQSADAVKKVYNRCYGPASYKAGPIFNILNIE